MKNNGTTLLKPRSFRVLLKTELLSYWAFLEIGTALSKESIEWFIEHRLSRRPSYDLTPPHPTPSPSPIKKFNRRQTEGLRKRDILLTGADRRGEGDGEVGEEQNHTTARELGSLWIIQYPLALAKRTVYKWKAEIIYSLLTEDRLCLWAPESANRRPTGPTTPAFILGLYWLDDISIVGCCSGGGGGVRGGSGLGRGTYVANMELRGIDGWPLWPPNSTPQSSRRWVSEWAGTSE